MIVLTICGVPVRLCPTPEVWKQRPYQPRPGSDPRRIVAARTSLFPDAPGCQLNLNGQFRLFDSFVQCPHPWAGFRPIVQIRRGCHLTRRTPKSRHRSEAILASAVAAFRKHGYHGTSMREIADALERTKGSLYYYFDTKAEILFAAHDRALDRMLAALERIESSGASPEEQLRLLVVEHVRAIVDGFHGTALALELDALPATARRRVIAKRDRFEHGLRRILARCTRTDADADAVHLTGFALLGAINWLARWYRPEGALQVDDIGRFFADLVLAGMRDGPALHTRLAGAQGSR